jgi:hypothetical protein
MHDFSKKKTPFIILLVPLWMLKKTFPTMQIFFHLKKITEKILSLGWDAVPMHFFTEKLKRDDMHKMFV